MHRSTLRTSLTSLVPTLLLGSALASVAAHAQVTNPTSAPGPQGAVVTRQGDIFFYKVRAVQQDIDAVNYLHRSGSTRLDFVGTDLLPEAKGEALVKSERGGITIDARFSGLRPANSFGQQFLTYVLWAISPDGTPQNLGEVLPAGTKNNITVTTSQQAFGLIVTAEPYFSVATPSDVVVLKNVFTDRTNGVLEHVTAHATLLPRGVYQEVTDGQHTVSHPITRDEHSPLELYEAYNAVRIATDAGAEQYAPDILAKANQNLKNAADIDGSKHRDEKMEITFARAAVQTAEDARVSTLRKKADERQRNAEAAAIAGQKAAAEADIERQRAEQQAAQAKLQAEQAALAAREAEAARAEANAQTAAARAQADAARQAAEAANQRAASAEQMREKLRAQLNEVLQTTETPRGLVVNLSDVLFDTGKSNLKANTQVSLARIAGILQSYPSLKVQVEGYTDTTGTILINQKLSQDRADTTRAFLIAQGVDPNSITATGYGPSNPVADNSTAAGRAQNRRVNLVVSGAAIGVEQSQPTASNQ